jgi:hypothetical protein
LQLQRVKVFSRHFIGASDEPIKVVKNINGPAGKSVRVALRQPSDVMRGDSPTLSSSYRDCGE